MSDLIVAVEAMATCTDDKLVRLPWDPVLNMENPREGLKVSRQVPETYGVQDGLNYFHAIDAFCLPSIKSNGLEPSLEGAQSCGERYLYTLKKRGWALESYGKKRNIPFRTNLDGDIAWREFQVVIGIGSLIPHPHHSKKVPRSNGRHQFLFLKGTYKPMWVEFRPCDNRVINFDCAEGTKEEKRRRNRTKKAVALQYTYDRTTQQIGKAPPPFVPAGPVQYDDSTATVSKSAPALPRR
jgi:hypothetical protein